MTLTAILSKSVIEALYLLYLIADKIVILSGLSPDHSLPRRRRLHLLGE